jgi:hypothetical protein
MVGDPRIATGDRRIATRGPGYVAGDPRCAVRDPRCVAGGPRCAVRDPRCAARDPRYLGRRTDTWTRPPTSPSSPRRAVPWLHGHRAIEERTAEGLRDDADDPPARDACSRNAPVLVPRSSSVHSRHAAGGLLRAPHAASPGAAASALKAALRRAGNVALSGASGTFAPWAVTTTWSSTPSPTWSTPAGSLRPRSRRRSWRVPTSGRCTSSPGPSSTRA